MAKTPTPKPASAIDAPATPPKQPWATSTITELPPEESATAETSPVVESDPVFEPAGSIFSEPPAGTPLTAEELAANGVTEEHPLTVTDADVQDVEPTSEPVVEAEPAPEDMPPVEESLTLGRGDDDANAGEVEAAEDEPTGNDGRPDGFIPGDQTAAGALTPPGGQHPGAPKDLLPGQPINLQDPYNVNGTQRNQELLAAGHGIRNPLLDKPDPNVVAAQSDAEDAEGGNRHA